VPRLSTIIKVTRAPFFASLVLSVCVGTAIAWHEGIFYWQYFLLSVIGIIFANAGLNMSNDYFDHLSGNDEANRELTPFSGGSRSIQEGILPARQVLMWSLFSYLVASLIGLYLTWVRGSVVLWLGIVGILLAFFSSAPPLRLNYVGHGLGELTTFLGSGPLIVLGSYYVQSQRLTREALWASIPVGLLGTALIWINEFPDYVADGAVGKSTLVVVLGRERAVWGFTALLAAIYAVILVGVALSIFPPMLLLVLLSLPLAYTAARGVMRFHSDTPRLIPISGTTIQFYVANALLMCLGYAIARFL
jgi:1,4-dihydroxy-2-naphthoate octaprenyltransferase